MGLTVELGARSYPLEMGALSELGGKLAAVTAPGPCVLVSNEVVGPLYARAALTSLEQAGFQASLEIIPDGEVNKTLATWQDLVHRLLALGVDRKTPVISLGGGVTGDIVGFAAASTMRGVPFVQVPTTLLAMVDASVGGKTGVNTERGKNLVGAFYQPILVHAALDTLGTLEPAELRCGLGEVLKHAVLEGEGFLGWLESKAAELVGRDPDALAHAVARCCAYKADIVRRDEREGGLRAILNCGHTLGHALERELGYGRLRHGEAVAVGMVAEAHMAVAMGLAEAGFPERIEALCVALGLPLRSPDSVPAQALVQATQHDKKRARGILTAALPCAPGKVSLTAVTPAELLIGARAVLPLEV